MIRNITIIAFSLESWKNTYIKIIIIYTLIIYATFEFQTIGKNSIINPIIKSNNG